MELTLRQLVRSRASDRCEYCHIKQDSDPFFRFHVEHIVPRQHGGLTTAPNLALACHHCNLHKGPNLTSIDPETGSISQLFNPRTQTWEDHFTPQGSRVIGKTPVGRATVRLLAMNAASRLQLRILAS